MEIYNLITWWLFEAMSSKEAQEMASASMKGDTPLDILQGMVKVSRGNPGAIKLLCTLPSDVLSGVLASSASAPDSGPQTTDMNNGVMRTVAHSQKLSEEDLRLIGRLAPLRVIGGKVPRAIFDGLINVGCKMHAQLMIIPV